MNELMKIATFLASVLFGAAANAATPIDGWYSSFFGGFAYVPGNFNKTYYNVNRSNVTYQSGFDGGGNFGYKSNPMRYEGEISYIKANTDKFKINSVTQTSVSGYNQAAFALANIYYDFQGVTPILQPYLGLGLGYGWVQIKLDSKGPSVVTNFEANSSVFAYHGDVGITFNFAENYALSLGYRYLTTLHIFDFGDRFQVHVANLGATYRFDG